MAVFMNELLVSMSGAALRPRSPGWVKFGRTDGQAVLFLDFAELLADFFVGLGAPPCQLACFAQVKVGIGKREPFQCRDNVFPEVIPTRGKFDEEPDRAQ